MRLHTAKASPFGRTVEIVAYELGLHEDIEIVSAATSATEPNRDLQTLTPMRKIPALELEDGMVLVDSSVICEYLAARVGDGTLFAADRPDHWRTMTDYALAKAVAESAVNSRYEMTLRPEEYRWTAWVDDQFDKIEATLTRFEGSPPASEGRINIAGIALGAALGYLDFRFAEWEWRDRFPGLAAWLEPVEARPSFAATRPA